MKKSVISLGLIGMFLLVTNLIFAQNVPSAADTQANTDVTTPPADQGNTYAAPTPNDVTSNEANANAILPTDTQANTDAGSMPADTQQTNTDEGTLPADTQTNSDVTSNSTDTQANTATESIPADTQANADETTPPADQANTNATTAPADTQANAASQ